MPPSTGKSGAARMPQRDSSSPAGRITPVVNCKQAARHTAAAKTYAWLRQKEDPR